MILRRLCTAFCWLLLGPAATAEEEAKPIVWPPGVEAKIDEALAIKKEAFKKSPTMRDADGAAATAFARCLDDIAMMPGIDALDGGLRTWEGRDLKAKIALWSLDRKARPHEYIRIGDRYVNRPPARHPTPDGEAVFIPQSILPRAGPRPVMPGDLDEAHRLILEHAFFAPPGGEALDRIDDARDSLAAGLGTLRDPRSVIVLREDLAMQMEAWPPDAAGRISERAATAIPALWSYHDAEVYPLLARYWEVAAVRKRIEYAFGSAFSRTSQPERYERQRKVYEDWQALAGRDWDTDGGKELAAYIKSLPPLPPAPLEKRK